MGDGVYIKGASATVSATPYQGYTFSGWSGACSGTGRCVVTMNGHKTVTANFSLIPAPRPTATPNALSYYNKGNDYFDDGNFQLAINELNTAIRLNPDFSDAYVTRSGAYGGLGQYQNSIQDANMVIQLDPDYAMAYNNRGYSYNELGQNQLAINDYNKAIQLGTNDAFAYALRHRIGQAVGKLTD